MVRQSQRLIKKRKLSHGQEQSEMVKLDQFALRFPDLTEKILGQLDNENLEKFKTVSRSLKMTVEKQRIYWIRKIQKYVKNMPKIWPLNRDNQFENEWKEAVEKTPIEILKKIATEIWTNSDIRNMPCYDRGMSPLGFGAASGDLDLFTYMIEEKREDLNSKDQIGVTPFHLAAYLGHYDICKVILEKSKEIPRCNFGFTPLHYAALKGHLATYKLVMKNLKDKNPAIGCDTARTRSIPGLTPLHEAAKEGHLAICDLIIKELIDKNPATERGVTPLHEAAGGGFLDICKLIVKKLADKNPAMNNGTTPLHWAALNGHLDVCELICNNVQNKNPEDHKGKTPLQIAHEKRDWKLLHFLLTANGLPLEWLRILQKS